MQTFVALLRAINVGGTGKLAMVELRALCAELGFTGIATYIQSGNVVFQTTESVEKAKARLEKALLEKMGKPIGVYLRTPAQLETILRSHPFQSAAPNQVIVLFLDAAPAAAEVAAIKIPANEEIVAIGSEVYVHFPEGQGKSKLKLPFATIATGRNLNTLTKLLELAR